MKQRVKKIHFVGIGGVGMCGIAEVLLNLGYGVSGSDLGAGAATKRLAAQGARIHLGHAAENIKGSNVVVTSTAVQADNPEVLAAREANIPVIPRAMMLAELMRFKQGIAIAGTHGKTTTTSLTASILAAANLDPTFVIGGKLTAAGTNAKLGSGEFLVAEADESDASFLCLTPIMAVVTNIDADHMDTYEHSFDKLKQAFVDFLHRMPFYGRAVVCIDDVHVREILPKVTRPVSTYGIDSADATIRAQNIVAVGAKMQFDVLVAQADTVLNFPVELNTAGLHNVLNALAAIGISLECGASVAAIQQGLSEFAGVGRRFTQYGEVAVSDKQGSGYFTLIDDYGHHPVEMAATLAAVRAAYPQKRLVLAFQPHRFSRTRDLFEDFARVLATVDVLFLTEVYAAGEAPIVAADGRALSRALRVGGKVEPIFIEDIHALPQAIVDFVQDGDVVVTMGAGDIGRVSAQICDLS